MTGQSLVSLSIGKGAPETEGQLKILLARRAKAARAGSWSAVDGLLLCSEVKQEPQKDLHSAEFVYLYGRNNGEQKTPEVQLFYCFTLWPNKPRQK